MRTSAECAGFLEIKNAYREHGLKLYTARAHRSIDAPSLYDICYGTKKLQTELLGDVCGNGTLVDEDVHRLVSHVGLGGVGPSART